MGFSPKGDLQFELGKRLARLLFRCWDHRPPACVISASELEDLIPLLIHGGGVALGWWRLRHSSLASSSFAQELHQAYRLQILQTKLQERQIKKVVSYLRSFNLEPIVAKGWAMSRLYPERGLRPVGDVDIYIRPEDHPKAVAAMIDFEEAEAPIDLHSGFALMKDWRFDEIYERTRLVSLDEISIRVLGAEDHLRLITLHMLEHGVWRPLWLCDVAISVEVRTHDFDWHYFFGGNERRARWLACALLLSQNLIGADLEMIPSVKDRKLPAWLIQTVLTEWGSMRTPHGVRTPMTSEFHRWKGLWRAIRERWPNPVEASVNVGAPFNDWPRLPIQIGECVRRTWLFILTPVKMLFSSRPKPKIENQSTSAR
jgi:hypothetical protein